MRHSVKTRFYFAPAMTALAIVLVVSGCQRPGPDGNAAVADANSSAALPVLPEALPLATGSPAPVAAAPVAAALPGRAPARRARLADPRGGNAYLDRAYGQSAAADVAPPDYAFRYGQVRPWAWQAADASREIVEPVPGGYRYYYYRPGADAPYLVRDTTYSYAYDGPALVAVFDREGRALPPDPGYDQSLYAGRYLSRALALYAASQANRSSVIAADWAAHRAQVDAARSAWAAQQAQQAAWQAYHAEHAAEEDAYWQGERARRAEAAARFADWHARAFNGPPPVLYAAAPRPMPVAVAAPVAVAHPAPIPVAVLRPDPASRPQTMPPRQAFVVPAATLRTVSAQPRMPSADHRPFVAPQRQAFATRPPASAAPVYAARPVEPRPAPIRPTSPPAHHPAPPERVVVARGADTPQAVPRREAGPPRAPEPRHEPSRPVAIARSEPQRLAPALHPPHPPEHRANAPHAEHHDADHHDRDHHEHH